MYWVTSLYKKLILFFKTNQNLPDFKHLGLDRTVQFTLRIDQVDNVTSSALYLSHIWSMNLSKDY